jgi:hypothetical protein
VHSRDRDKVYEGNQSRKSERWLELNACVGTDEDTGAGERRRLGTDEQRRFRAVGRRGKTDSSLDVTGARRSSRRSFSLRR